MAYGIYLTRSFEFLYENGEMTIFSKKTKSLYEIITELEELEDEIQFKKWCDTYIEQAESFYII